MAGLRYKFPVRAIGDDGPAPGGFLSVLLPGGDDYAPLFADADLTVPLANPLEADGGGYFPAVYLEIEDDDTFDVTITDANGNQLAQYLAFQPDILPLAVSTDDPVSMSGAALGNATLAIFLSETTELLDVFADEDLTTPLDNPVEANGAGVFPAMWLSIHDPMRAQLKDGNGVLQYDVDHTIFFPGNVPPSTPVLTGELDAIELEIDLEWTAATSQFSTVEGYRLYRSTDGGAFVLLVDQAGLTYVDATIEEGHSYTYYVVAYDANGLEGEQSNQVAFSIGASIEIIESSRDWIKPVGLLSVEVTCIGGGGGGAGGGGRTSIIPYSGGGGQGGGISRATFAAGDLPDTVTCTVGAGGLKGLGRTAFQLGFTGSNGGDTSFGAFLEAEGGDGGAAENSASSGLGDGTLEDGGTGAAGNRGGTNIASNDGGDRSFAGGGGGGGPTYNAAEYPGGAGGSVGVTAGGAGGATDVAGTAEAFGEDGQPGANSATYDGGGGGGAGGAARSTSNPAHGGNGGDGGKYGGGGGGGAVALGDSSGVSHGGDGGDGGGGAIILRYTYVS